MRELRIAGIFFMFLLIVAVASFVLATPTGPNNLTVISSQRYSTAPSQTTNAMAGNVSELSFAANTITQTWQGYFGNITGTIVLGNSNNQSLYSWNLISAHGQIYATRTSTVPAWTSVKCANLTEVQGEDTALNVNESVAADSVNNTFLNTTDFAQFYVGAININTSQGCFAARLYNSTGQSSTTHFGEVLLKEPGTNIIYTSILDQKALGFDSRTHDFEMLVGEDGHSGDTSTTPYYFYVELS